MEPLQPLVRRARGGRRRARARHRAGERRAQRATLDESFHLGRGGRRLAAALLETGRAGRGRRAAPRVRAAARSCALIAGSWRARCLELLDALLARARPPRRGERAAAARARPGPRPCGCRWPPPGPIAPRPPSSSHAGDAGARSRAGARLGRGRRRGRRAGRGRAVAHARRPRARPGRRARPRRRPSCSARPRRSSACGALRYRDEAERELRKLGHRIHRRTRPGKADGDRASSR